MKDSSYIIWDFDGTLGSRAGMWSGTLLEVVNSHGMGESLTAESFRPFLTTGFRWHSPHIKYPAHLTADQWWTELEPVFQRAFQKGAGLDAMKSRHLAKSVRQVYCNPDRWSLFSDTQQALNALSSEGWRHVLLTNHVPEIDCILRSLGIRAHFESIFNSANTGIEKPHPDAFENVRQSLPAKSKLWMIGDNFAADFLGAEAVGIPAILVRKSHPEATRYADDLAGAITILSTSN